MLSSLMIAIVLTKTYCKLCALIHQNTTCNRIRLKIVSERICRSLIREGFSLWAENVIELAFDHAAVPCTEFIACAALTSVLLRIGLIGCMHTVHWGSSSCVRITVGHAIWCRWIRLIRVGCWNWIRICRVSVGMIKCTGGAIFAIVTKLTRLLTFKTA